MPNCRTYKEDEHAVCCFYKKESKTAIRCDGLIGTHTTNIFFSNARKEDYKASRCCGSYYDCRLYKALMRKYSETIPPDAPCGLA